MINEKIVNAIKPLGIQAYYQKVREKTDKYIMFSIYNRKHSDHADNKNLGDKYYITLKFYFIESKDLEFTDKIIRNMKLNGFAFDGESDLITDSKYFGKELDFILNTTTMEDEIDEK